jgi:hypothetical protein
VKSLGDQGGAGNLVICEVLVAHVNEGIFDDHGVIDPYKLDAVARLGGDWYSRASGDSLFKIPKPIRTLGIGVDQIPLEIRQSAILTGNNLGRLGNVEALPAPAEIEDFGKNSEIHEMKIRFQHDQDSWYDYLHLRAKEYLEADEVENAWLTLLQYELKA